MATRSLRLQELTAAHVPAYAEVLAELHNEAFPDAPWGVDAMTGALGQPGAFGFIALDDGDEPLGFVVMRAALFDGGQNGGEVEVLTIATRPACRRRGVARALMEAALTHAGRLGADRAFLEVAASNGAARSLYASLDFAEVGRRKAYYARRDGVREDALVLALKIPPGSS